MIGVFSLEAIMTTKKLERSDWQRYFDQVAKNLPAMRVGVSVLGMSIGVQPETEESALIGISYDSNDDVLVVATPNVSHQIANPQEIHVREKAGTLSSVEVLTADGIKQIVELTALPSLPAS
mgnify:CR=1 FL=1